MSSYLYYPGCSLTGSARAYASSLQVVVDTLGVELREIDDWNCCGATEYLTLSPLAGYALIGRNLALAETQRNGAQTLVAPCSACYVNLAKTDRYMRESATLSEKLNAALGADGLHYTPGSVAVRHLLEILMQDVGLDEIARHVTRPLAGLRVAPYLGCLISRPDYDERWARREQPRELDRLMEVVGADVVDYPLRTACCGGHMTQISPNTGFELIRRLIAAADRLEADVLVTACPMCQMNLDAYQAEMNRHFGTHYRLPILFFTQLIGLAFNADPKELGIGTEIVSACDALAKIGVEALPCEEESDAPPAKRPKRPQGLPMPKVDEVAPQVAAKPEEARS